MDSRRRTGPPIATPLALAAVTVAAFIAALFPLTGTPGPEAAQILSVVGGPALLLAAAARGSHQKEGGFRGDLLVQLALLAICVLVFGLVTSVSSLSHPSCAPGRGYLPFVLVAVPALLLNSAVGLWIGRTLGRPQLAVGTAVLLLVGYAGWMVLEWFLEPSFRVLSHLLVLIEGDLVQGRSVSPAAVAFRSATLLFASGLIVGGLVRFPRARRSGLSSQPGPSPALLLVAGGLLVAGFVVHAQSRDALAPDRGDLEEAYSLERRRGPLVVHADPEAITMREVDAILAEGTLWLERLKDRMGVEPEGELHIWLHPDHATMGHYTGAENVHFALPGRGELHISGVDVPHPTLGHELAHLLGRRLTGGVLGVPTRFGLLPNAGIIEGLAMAVTPELEVRYGLTLREKAAAMRRAGLAPPLRDLFGEYLSFFGFWRHPPGNAYVTAGALVEAVAATQGTDGLARLYREGSLEDLFDDDEALERFLKEHEAALDAMPLPPDATAQVAHSYSRASILDQTCDPGAEDVARAIRAAARSGDFAAAESLSHEAEGDALTGKTLVALAHAARLLDDDARALAYLLQRADARDTEDPRERALRLEEVGDALWAAGRRREALARWEQVPKDPLSPPQRRMIEAKGLLARALVARPAGSPVAEAGLALLLAAGSGDTTPEVARLAVALGRATAATEELPEVLAFGEYLLARQYLQRGAIDDGIDGFLRCWERKGALDEPFQEQVLRGLAAGHARRGDFSIAKEGFRTIAEKTRRAAVRIKMRDRAERVERMAESRASQDPATAGDRWLLGLRPQTDL